VLRVTAVVRRCTSSSGARSPSWTCLRVSQRCRKARQQSAPCPGGAWPLEPGDAGVSATGPFLLSKSLYAT
jgi:hypothetical protein